MGRNKGVSGLLDALSRRRFMQGAAAMGLTITAMPKFAAAADENLVNFYNWDTYIGETTLADFTKATGIEVKLDLFADNDELFAKLRGGNPGYDVVVPSGNWVARMSQADMLTPLDHSLIPNIRHITPRFISSSSFDPGRKFSLPYMWGTIGIGYRKSKFTEPPASWKWLYDSDKYSGRMALKYLGYSLNTTDDALLAQAEALIIKQKPHIKAFAEDNGQDLLASGEVDLVMEWNGDIAQLMAEDPDIGYVVPVEGGVLWEDTLAIPKGAPHLKNAHAFINFLHDPEVNAGIATTVQYATPNQSALARMDASYTGNPVIFAPQPVIEVTALHMRREPIITAALMARFPACEIGAYYAIQRSARVWDDLETIGVAGVRGVYTHPAAASGWGMLVVSLQQQYAGHVAQVLALAAQCPAAAYYTKWIIAVDDDVDPTDLNQVLWALSTRCNPSDDLDILRNTLSTGLDPSQFPPENRPYGSKVLINACKSHKHLQAFPKSTFLREATYHKVAARWGELGFDGAAPEQRQFHRD